MKKIRNMMILSMTVLCLIILSACEEKASSTITLKPNFGDVKGAKVTLLNNSGKKSQVYTQTASGTSVLFKKIAFGSYTLSVEHKDYFSFKRNDVTIHNTVPGYTANLIMRGPGGGFVFYDKGSVSDGWRYLEAAPADTEFITNRHTAVYHCGQMKVNGLTGWFLPYSDQLNLMYTNLHRNGLAGFQNDFYWSGEVNLSGDLFQNFSNGRRSIMPSNSNLRVRAVRAF